MASYFDEMITSLPVNATTFGDLSNSGDHYHLIFSEKDKFWTRVILAISLNIVTSVLGMAGNIINIIVFIRQGVLSDSSNVTFLALAITDFICLFTVFGFGVLELLAKIDFHGTKIDWLFIKIVIFVWPHLMITLVTCWITAFLAFERCICVVFPFKARHIFTPKRALAVVTIIFVLPMLSHIPPLQARKLTWVDNPHTNTSRLTFISLPNAALYRKINGYLNSISSRVLAILTVFICTQITAYKMRAAKSWKQSMNTMATTTSKKNNGTSTKTSSKEMDSSNNDPADADSKTTQNKPSTHNAIQKEVKLIWMIIAISIVFLLCHIPYISYLTIKSFIPEVKFRGRQYNYFVFILAFSFFFEAINSSINIVIYYNMSSKYKAQFLRLFGRS